MKALLLLFLASGAWGQTLPEQVKDPATSEVAEYLDQQIRKNLAAANAAATCTSGTCGAVTLSSVTTVTGPIYINSILTVGAQGAANPLNVAAVAYSAQSIDGATQSSGCVVAVTFSTGSAAGVMQFTSSTTIWNSVDQSTGILLESCVPGSTCRIGMGGIFRLQAGALIGDAQFITPSTTRCRVDGVSTWDGTVVGRKMSGPSGVSPSEFVWVRLDH